MTEDSRRAPRPTPRPAAGCPAARPSPRPRVAGSRRDRDDAARTPRARRAAACRAPAGRRRGARGRRTRDAEPRRRPKRRPADARPARRPLRRAAAADAVPGGRRAPARRPPAGPAGGCRLAARPRLLCLLAAAAGGFLLWQRLHPPYVDASVFAATRSGVQALYAFDYKHSDASVDGKLAVLTGDLRDQYQKDLSQGGIIDTYKQVSATTSYDVLDVGLQQINDAQDTATLVVFGQYVVKSANSGNQPAPQGSECR